MHVLATSGVGVAFTVGYAVILMRKRLELNRVVGIALVLAGVGALLYFTS